MLVKNFMTATVITMREDQNLLEARELMRGKNLLSLPVVDDIGRLRGIITAVDIGRASPGDASTLSKYEANYLLGRLKVREVMSRSVITVNADDTIEYVAYQLYKYRIHALPVVDENNKLCGIISQTDMFRAIVEMMNMNRGCTRMTLETADRVGVLAEVCNIFKENNISIISLVTKQNSDGNTEITIRADLSVNGMDVIEHIREAGYDVQNIMTIQGLE